MLECWLESFLAMIGTFGVVGSMAIHRQLRGDVCVSLVLKATQMGCHVTVFEYFGCSVGCVCISIDIFDNRERMAI